MVLELVTIFGSVGRSSVDGGVVSLLAEAKRVQRDD